MLLKKETPLLFIWKIVIIDHLLLSFLMLSHIFNVIYRSQELIQISRMLLGSSDSQKEHRLQICLITRCLLSNA